MYEATLLFPHQLFENNPVVEQIRPVYLVEEWLFFKQYRFHKRKITFHRASMKFYQSYLIKQGIKVEYIDTQNQLSDIRKLIPHLKKQRIHKLHIIEVTDDWLESRIKKTAQDTGIEILEYNTPMFLNTSENLVDTFSKNKRLLHSKFYIDQRIKRSLLINEKHKPVGGKWSYDSENRQRYPNSKIPPSVKFAPENKFITEAIQYTEKHFSKYPGELDNVINYPTTFGESKEWLVHFFQDRLNEFGPFEDAIVQNELILHHSLLTPMLNSGLLTPDEVLKQFLNYCSDHDVPLNSKEGFLRQLIGWREFIRGVYLSRGVEQRTINFWNFTRKIPTSFYNGTTGIEPVDIVIRKVLKTGYCHHIERLMILGNFMVLCEFNPDEVYRWFMELFIDAYDWVMVPNVYGMSQFADGGILATKPYISGSNYILKMSDHKKGEWQKTWDALFWRFMHLHREFFLQNPRMGMLIRSFDKMPDVKRDFLLAHAQQFLAN